MQNIIKQLWKLDLHELELLSDEFNVDTINSIAKHIYKSGTMSSDDD